jgi:hypothetical protein
MFIANNASIFERAWIRTWTGAYPAAQHPPKEQFTASAFTHHHHAAAYVAHGHIAPQSAFAAGFGATNKSMSIAAYPPADTHPFYYLLIWTGAFPPCDCAFDTGKADARDSSCHSHPCRRCLRHPDPGHRRLLRRLPRVCPDPRQYA